MRNVLILLLFLTLYPMQVNGAQFDQSVLVVGDSLSIPLGQRLEEHYALSPKVNFHRKGKVSSGLARPDFFNWESNLTKLVRSQKPDTVIIMIGTNDDKPLKSPNGKRHSFTANSWDKEYARRMHVLFDITRQHNPQAIIYWVGAPIMGRKTLDKNVQRINRVIESTCKATPNTYYIDTREVLADHRGRYTPYVLTDTGKKMRTRAKDGVHVTKTGSALLADCTLTAMKSTPAPAMLAEAAPQKTPAQTPRVQQKTERKPSSRTSGQLHVAHTNTKKQDNDNRVIASSVRYPSVKTTDAPMKLAKSSSALRRLSYYSIQESSWATKTEASNRAQRLQNKGLQAHVTKVNLGPRGVWHRVMIGNFKNLQSAKQHKKVLKKRYALQHTLILKLT